LQNGKGAKDSSLTLRMTLALLFLGSISTVESYLCINIHFATVPLNKGSVIMTGLVHIYTGNGKGKTTAACGLAIRAWGSGLKVLMIQFLKGSDTGEIKCFEKLGENFVFHRGRKVKGFVWNMNEEQLKDTRNICLEDLEWLKNEITNCDYDLLIMDEVMGCLSNGFLNIEEILEFIKNKPEKLEIVMTGRNAPKELIDIADYVSVINAQKHPFDKGIPARKGIEY